MPKPLPRKGRDAATARRPAGPEHHARARAARRAAVHATFAVALVGGVVILVDYLKATVGERAAAAAATKPEPPKVVFVSRPAWMSDYLAAELGEVCRPAGAPDLFDRDALVAINGRLRASPWIAKVRQVRRAYGRSAGDTIEVDCDFRAPLALVRAGTGDDYWFVDAKGVRLPERFAGQEVRKVVYAGGKVNLRVVEGVRNPPPARAGQPWPGDDLAAGLELAERLNGQPFADEVERVDVSNYGGRQARHEAHLVLVTRHGTQVRWGRPWSAVDAFVEVRPELKVETLKQIVAGYGRIDAGKPWIDVRFEAVSHPPVATTQEGGR